MHEMRQAQQTCKKHPGTCWGLRWMGKEMKQQTAEVEIARYNGGHDLQHIVDANGKIFGVVSAIFWLYRAQLGKMLSCCHAVVVDEKKKKKTLKRIPKVEDGKFQKGLEN